ncbi:hypothetical protein GGR50DRAFT_172501 [Xylaria sp. CBS 124048]|nr:hypothetical protein GGR50DRAFT_172501 [Xylaria sp. CBS 124048]
MSQSRATGQSPAVPTPARQSQIPTTPVPVEHTVTTSTVVSRRTVRSERAKNYRATETVRSLSNGCQVVVLNHNTGVMEDDAPAPPYGQLTSKGEKATNGEHEEKTESNAGSAKEVTSNSNGTESVSSNMPDE